MHSELAGLVAARADHTSRPRVAADDHGLAAQLRPIALLNRGEERVEVDVDDAEAADGHIRMMASPLVPGERLPRPAGVSTAGADPPGTGPPHPRGASPPIESPTRTRRRASTGRRGSRTVSIGDPGSGRSRTLCCRPRAGASARSTRRIYPQPTVCRPGTPGCTRTCH